MEFLIVFGIIILTLIWIVTITVRGIKLSKKQKDWKCELPVSWQSKLATLTENFDNQNTETFYNEICKLATRYKSPPNARNIYFQSYQFLAKQNSNHALLLYLQYLHVRTPNANFRHRKVSEEYKKLLFQNKTQAEKFQQLCDRLKENRNLEQAENDAKQFFRIHRREISLDTQAVKDVGREHAKTAALLGKYLEDEPEIVEEIIEEKSVSSDILEEETNESILFRLFEKHNFTLNKKEIDTFARNNGVFAGSLIQQINETYYETLDDLLIEDEEENYTLNKAYYESIKE